MRIAFLTPAFPLMNNRAAGGVEGVSQVLASALARQPEIHLEVFVPLAETYGIRAYTRLDHDGLVVHAIPSRSQLPGFLRVLWLRPQRLLRLAGDAPFDLVHVQDIPFWAARLRQPAVLTIHGLDERDLPFRGPGPLRRLWLPICRPLNERARARVRNVICISPYVRSLFRPRPGQRLWDIENPVADAFFETARQPVSGRVLYVGHICLRKNVCGLIAGFSAAAKGHPDWELRLVGRATQPAYAEQCHALAHRLGLSAQVRFLGPLEPEGVRRELSQAAVLALCSLNETAPLAISEAMACGVPVLASAICGIPSLVADGQTGRLVDPANPEAIAAALRSLLTADDLLALGVRARQAAQLRFRAATAAANTLEVYREITQPRR